MSSSIHFLHLMRVAANLILLLLFFGCSNKRPISVGDEIIKVILDEEINHSLPANEWIENIEFLCLETNEDCLISSKMKFDLNSKYIVIESENRINLFDRSGKHLVSFYHHGLGPGEYFKIWSIFLIPGMDEIGVVDKTIKKLFVYDFNGILVTETNLPFPWFDVVPLSDSLFAFYLNQQLSTAGFSKDRPKNEIVVLNRDGNIENGFLPFDHFLEAGIHTAFSKSGANGVYMINPDFQYNIFQIGPGNNFEKKYQFDFGKYNIDTTLIKTPEFITSNPMPVDFGPGYMMTFLAITTNTICFWGTPSLVSEQRALRLVNRKSSNQLSLGLDDQNNIGYFHGLPINLFPIISSNEHFVKPVQAIDLIDMISNLTENQNTKLSRFTGFNKAMDIKEDDNPVFFLIKIKDM